MTPTIATDGDDDHKKMNDKTRRTAPPPPPCTSTPPMPLLPITSLATVGMCATLPLRHNDVFICSYPKSGTTWTQHIVISLLLVEEARRRRNSGESEGGGRLGYDHVSDYAPFFEVDQHWDASTRDLIAPIRSNHERIGRRIFNTHLRWDMLPSSGGDGSTDHQGNKAAKFIYLVRSPMDVCLSFYCHLSNQEEGGYEGGTFEAFFDDWIHGKIAFGSWVDHVLSFAPALVDSGSGREVMLVSYEEMLTDLPGAVARISKFIGADITEEERKALLPTFTFQGMKSDLDRFQPRSVTWKNEFKFLRRGVSGDSLGVASDAQRLALEEWMEREGFVDKLKSVLSDNQQDLQKILGLL